MQTEIRRIVERKVDEYSRSEKSLEPVEEADMGIEVGCVEDLQRLCRTKANITQHILDPTKCTVRGEGDSRDRQISQGHLDYQTYK